MKSFRGFRVRNKVHVIVVEMKGSKEVSRKDLTLTNTGRRHSPSGFEWGYGGSGPAALAHSILVEASGSKKIADDLYQKFKAEVVSKWPETSFEIANPTVLIWIQDQLANSSERTPKTKEER